MTQYPGPDPVDPFAKPPNESGADAPPSPPAADAPTDTPAPAGPDAPAPPGVEETAPIQREEMGYWERKALEDQARAQQEAGQQGDAGSGAPPPPPPASPYGQPAADPMQTYGGTPTWGQPQEQQPGQHPGQQQPSYEQYPAPPPTGGYQTGQYGQPQQYGQPYGQPQYGQGYAQPYGYGAYQRPHPQAQTAMVLGLIGLVGGFLCCGVLFVLSPFAWSIGAKARREIRASQGQLGGDGQAQAGFVMGIIGTVLLALAIVAFVIFGIAIATGSGDANVTTSY